MRSIATALLLGSARLHRMPSSPPPRTWVRACDAGGGGGGGITGGGNGGGGGDSDGGEDDSILNVPAALAQAGLDLDAVPDAILGALKSGRIGAKELANWQTVQQSGLLRTLALSGYVRARLLAEPRLPTVLGIEVLVGSVSLLAAEAAARGDALLSELDFVLANQALIICSNAALVLALCPAAQLAAPAAPGTIGAFMACLPGYVLQKGDFSAWQRAATVLTKAVQFSAVGAASSAAGQGLTAGLIKLRKQLTGKAPSVTLAPVGETAVAFAYFMAGSSNPRYQLVNSFEGRLLPLLPGGATVQTGTSVALRTVNNYAGAASWVWWAKFRGLQ